MEINDYLRILRKSIWTILATVVIFVALALTLTWRVALTYQSSSAIEITRNPIQTQTNVEYFLYDNFYNTQVATTFANNVIGWIGAPSVVAQTYQQAGYDIPAVNLRDLGKTFTAKKKTEGSSVVDISYGSKDREKAQKMITTLTAIIKEKVESNNTKDSSAKFAVNISQPVIVPSPKAYALNAVVAGLFGLFLSISFSLISRGATNKNK